MYRVRYARDVLKKDMPKLKSANLLEQFFKELAEIKQNPFAGKNSNRSVKGQAFCAN